jgi:small subunit ribosomal protein S8
MPASKIKVKIAEILAGEGYIDGFEIKGELPKQELVIKLRYLGPDRVLTGLKRISKPGLRTYTGKDGIPRVLGGMGISILSTSHGIMTGRQAAKIGVGGEIICQVW